MSWAWTSTSERVKGMRHAAVLIRAQSAPQWAKLIQKGPTIIFTEFHQVFQRKHGFWKIIKILRYISNLSFTNQSILSASWNRSASFRFFALRSRTLQTMGPINFWSSIWIIIYISNHTTYRKNNNLEKCAGMGLNGFHIKSIIGTHCNWKNQNPGSPLGATC